MTSVIDIDESSLPLANADGVPKTLRVCRLFLTLFVFFAFLTLFNSCNATEIVDKETRRLAFFRAALAAPAEYAAAAYLRVTANSNGKDKKNELDLLEKAFTLAENSVAPTPLTLLGQGRWPALFASPRARGRLDRLSLQIEAVRQMSRLDADRALVFLGRVHPPVLSWVGCNSKTMQDTTGYYTLTSELFKSKGYSERISVGMKLLGAANSEGEIAPAIAAWKTLSWDATADDLNRGVLAIASLLGRARGNDQSFSASWVQIDNAFSDYNNSFPGARQWKNELQKSYRDFLIDHFSRNRCAQNARGENFALEDSYIASRWASLMIPPSYHIMSPYAELAENDIEPAQKTLLFRAVELAALEFNRRLELGGAPPQDWILKVDKLLDDMRDSAYEPDDAKLSLASIRETALKELMLTMASENNMSRRIFSAVLGELSTSPAFRLDPTRWYITLLTILESPEVQELAFDNVTSIEDVLIRSGQPGMVLEGALLKFLASGPPQL